MKTTQDLKNEIILELLFKNKIQIGELIDYEKFKSLYQDYSYLPEYYFASILGIFSLKKIKKGSKISILKDIDEEVYNKLVEYMNRNNIVHNDSKITYDEFLNILSKAPFLGENVLARILGISEISLQNIKYHSVTRTYIHVYDITEEEKQIVDKLIKDGLLYPGKKMTYTELLQIYNLFPNMPKTRFAYVFEVDYNGLTFDKKKNQETVILKSWITNYVNCKKEFIINDLITNRNAKLKEKINYDRFCELYKGYEYIKESTFAQIILGISYGNFMQLKRDRNRSVIILKNLIDLTDNMRIYYFNHIINQFNINEGDSIEYSFFHDICETYQNILTENDISIILGVSKRKYHSMKYENEKIRIFNGVNIEKIQFMKKKLLESRFYSKEEIYKIISEYGITIEQFIFYIIKSGYFSFTKDYQEALEKNNGLFIGKTKLDGEFIEKNYDKISEIIRFTILNIGVRDDYLLEEVIQQALIYTYEKCGDLYYNFGDSDIFYRKFVYRVKRFMIGCLHKENKNGYNYIYNDDLIPKRYQKFNYYIYDKIIDDVDDGQPGESYKNLNLYNACLKILT